MRLEAALEGNLSAYLKAEQQAITRALESTLREVSLAIRDDARNATITAGLGKLSKSWKSQLYLKDNAAFIYTDSPRVMSPFAKGGIFASKDGKWLAIPTDAAPKKGVGGGRINPSTFPESSYGKLRFVYVNSKLSLLVADNLRARGGKRGGFGKASNASLKTGRGLTSVVMFILVPRVRFRKRFDIGAIKKRWLSALPGILAGHINKHAETLNG